MLSPRLTLLLPLLFGCADDPLPCPGLPDEIPSDWSVVPPGLDTDAFDAHVEERMRAGCIPALSVSVVDADGALLTASWGYADLEQQIPATTETPFMMASVSKAVDALAVLVAQEQGLLGVDDPVSDLVGFRVRNERIGGGPPIRLKHLATHSSGIRDNWDILDPSYVDGDSPIALGSFMRGYLRPGGKWFSSRNNFHLWPAGREWMYSNTGAALAAYAVEARSGQPYDAYSRAHVLSPLGMTHSGWFLADFDPEVVARPHEVGAQGWKVLDHYGFPTYPDGQLRATAGDMGQVLRVALAEGTVDGTRLLSPESVRALSTPPVASLDDWYIKPHCAEQYLFWFAQDLGDRRLIGHDGDDIGVSTEMFYEPATGIGVVVLTNITDGYGNGRVRRQTRALQHELFALGEVSR